MGFDLLSLHQAIGALRLSRGLGLCLLDFEQVFLLSTPGPTGAGIDKVLQTIGLSAHVTVDAIDQWWWWVLEGVRDLLRVGGGKQEGDDLEGYRASASLYEMALGEAACPWDSEYAARHSAGGAYAE